MKRKYYLYVLIIITTMFSCKTTGKIARKGVTSDTLITLIKNIQSAQPDFQTANVSKMGLEITYNNRKYNVAANCKIIKDSALYVSIQPVLGIELFKAEITPDSIHLFDKMNRRLYALDYNYIYQKTGLNINYTDLQALISNRLFCLAEIKIPIESCTMKKELNGKSVLLYNTKKFNQTTFIAENNTIEKVTINHASSKYNLTTEYSDYKLTDSINFPYRINVNLNGLQNKILCNFNITKVTFNTKITLSKSDKRNFTRSKIEHLLNK